MRNALAPSPSVAGFVAGFRRFGEAGMSTTWPGTTEPHPLQVRHARHSGKPFRAKRLRHVEALGPAAPGKRPKPVAALGRQTAPHMGKMVSKFKNWDLRRRSRKSE